VALVSATLFIIVGGIIALGFFGNLFAERTRIPEILILIAIGMFLGPILHIIPLESVRSVMPIFGPIALTIILFEGGLDLHLGSTVRQAGRATLLALVSFAVAMLLVYYALVLGLQVHGRTVWAMAAALACTSAPIVIPVLARALPNSPVRPLLVVESALSDALAVIVVLMFQRLEGEALSGARVAEALGHSLLIGGGAAILVGIVWLWLLSRYHERKYFYLMTVGVVFLLMGGVESYHGSGALAVLLFGVILANGESLYGYFGEGLRRRLAGLFGGGKHDLHRRISDSHAEISLLVRSFFFVYLGIIFRWPGTDLNIWLSILLVLVAVIVGREISVQLVGWSTRVPARHRAVLRVMLPRGLATAVLTAMLVDRGQGAATEWEILATFVVIVTNIWMTARLLKLRAPTAAAEETS
jgi:potassium/hydrogen antiporter